MVKTKRAKVSLRATVSAMSTSQKTLEASRNVKDPKAVKASKELVKKEVIALAPKPKREVLNLANNRKEMPQMKDLPLSEMKTEEKSRRVMPMTLVPKKIRLKTEEEVDSEE